MPNINSKIKNIRQSEKKRKKNIAIKSSIKTFCKNIDLLVAKPITEKVKEEANQKLNLLYKILDKSSGQGIIKKNKAARKKSQYAQKVYSLDKKFNTTTKESPQKQEIKE